MLKTIFFIFYLILLIRLSLSQQYFIKNVPDYSQPPADSLPSTIDRTNYCAPFAFLNIVSYWDSVQQDPYALGVKAGLPPAECAEYIGWFMDTNDQGSNARENGNGRQSAAGTYVMDQWWGALEYIQSDQINSFGFPYPIPPAKHGYGWDIQLVPVPDFMPFKEEIDAGNPVKLDFLYWIIYNTGVTFYDSLFADDTIYFYDWALADSFSGTIDEQDPYECWNLQEDEGNIGHAVTAVGYFENYKPPDTSYVIVHDNWSNTPRNIAIPWMNIASWFFIHLPEPPDLTIIRSEALIDTSAGIPDTLWINESVSVRNVIRNVGPGVAASYMVDVQVTDPGDLLIALDTITVSQYLDPNDSMLVVFDSLFKPLTEGNYKIISHVHWDQNRDSLINDPDDLNPLNDSIFINISVYKKDLYHPFTMIADVPDINQPPATSLASTIANNFCAPMAAVNITTYWECVQNHSNAIGVNAGLAPDTVAEYIGWFMDTNNRGNPQASNGVSYPIAPGTYTIDQFDFFSDYIRWDANHPYSNAPAIPPGKNGYDWTINIDYVVGSSYYQNQIDNGLPAKIDFLHWNIIYSDTMVIDTVNMDTVYLYSWGEAVPNSGGEPWEEWNYSDWEGPANIGHAVTGVGYFIYQGNFYAIVHDNWPSTPQNVAVPWNNWMATISVDPTIPVSIADENQIIKVYRLYQNFPNPFNPITKINYQLPQASNVELVIYNILGQKLITLVSKKQDAGLYSYEWNANNFASGIYICRLTAGKYVKFKKMILLK
jgi:hypothetical protein